MSIPTRCHRRLGARALVAVAALLLPAALHAQRPTASEAQLLLETRPDLVQQLRDRLLRSGLTPEQVRARLKAEGYPPNLLDAYLTSSASAPPPSDSTFAALAALGIDTTTRAPRTTPAPASVPARPADSADVEIFGLNIFRGQTSAFDATIAGPVDANYVLGPGDQLVLVLTGEVELAQTLDVTREGLVVVPRVGQMHVANLTLGQFETMLGQRLSAVLGPVGRSADAPIHYSVTVSRLRVNQVFVVGDVAAPGSYQVSSAGTALTALYAAGGPTDDGSLRRVEVRRGGAVVGTLDLYDYLLRGDASRDVRLRSGDVVFVPVHGPHVRVEGEVVRPAVYELRSGETVADVLRAAGGFTAGAAQQRVLLERILPPERRSADGRDRVVLDIAPAQFAGAAGRLEAGDVVRVFPVAEQVRDRVTVVGSVWAPGAQALTPGMTVSAALRQAGGLRPDAYLQQVLVTRPLPDSTHQQLRATLRDRDGTVVDDFELRENDEIRVFGAGEFRTAEYVTISGAVRKGGEFLYRRGMTLRDLVLLAGGLTDGAFLEYAEVARVRTDGGDASRVATSLRAALDSSYVRSTGAGPLQFGTSPAATALAPDVVLEPNDNVLILQRPDYAEPRTVVVGGQVRYPGRYTLLDRAERLSDVIARAGGLTTEAYAHGAQFHRAAGDKGRVGIDLPRVLADRSDRDNLVLQDGDSIVVPQYAPIVEVTGAVNSPVSVAYVPDAPLDYYIRAAGGATRRADASHTYVTQPNGRVESARARRLRPDVRPEPQAGSTVHVPVREETPQRDLSGVAATTAQVLGALVALVAVMRR